MTAMDIEVRGQPGPTLETLRRTLGALGHRALSPEAHGPPAAEVVLFDLRGEDTSSQGALGPRLAHEKRPALVLTDRAPAWLAELARDRGTLVLAVDPAGSEATCRVGIALCAALSPAQWAVA